ncbi:MAG TPA: T9SS type A sorting domain-containing protein [Chitinophagaceae bacterium]|nr:T9SS type A sorting domain-containing protein [Chitinophagaceae bacterium]
MKLICTSKRGRIVLLLTAVVLSSGFTSSAQVCADVANTIYGLTPTGAIHPITTGTATVGAAITPAYTGHAPSYANAIGFNNVNGRFYYFKRNINTAPQEFVSFNPGTNTITPLSNCPLPANTIVNLGCMLSNGTGYYCIDAYGKLLYYNVLTNVWTLISSNLVDQYGTNLTPIFNARIYGDMATDAQGNLWIMPASATQLGLYKLPAPLPTTPQASITVQRVLAPTTPTPNANTIGGIAFNPAGNFFISTNPPDNKLFRMNENQTFTLMGTFNVGSVGNDLASCVFPFGVLSASWQNFSVELEQNNDALLSWTMGQDSDNKGYHIEHSINATEWNTIGFVTSKNANGSRYSFVDNSRLIGKHYYRVRVETVSGQSVYSAIRMVELKNGRTVAFGHSSASGILRILLSNAGSRHTAMLFDQTGRQLKVFGISNGLNTLDISGLPRGMYVVKVICSSGEHYSDKFVKG